jgi:hypothetical protein
VIVEALETRALLANIFEINSSIIHLEQDRLNARKSIGDEIRQVKSDVLQFMQDAADKTNAILNDYFDHKAQEEQDAATGDEPAVRADRRAERQDLRDFNQVKHLTQADETVGQRVLKALTQASSQEDWAINQDEGMLEQGAITPEKAERLGDRQSNSTEVRGTREYNDEFSRKTNLEDILELVPSGSGTVSGPEPGPGPSPEPGQGPSPQPGPASGQFAGSYQGPVDLTNNQPFASDMTANLNEGGGRISGTVVFAKYPDVDPNSGLIVGTTPNVSATLSGTYQSGGSASGTFTIHLPGGDAPLQWTGTVTASDVTINLGSDAGTNTLHK